MFFGSIQNFNDKFDPINDPEAVEIDFIESKVSDHSGIEAMRGIANKYITQGKSIKFTHLSPDCKTLLMRANPKFKDVIKDSVDDPRYYVVTDKLDVDV